jgi:hypothetical protein
MFARFVASEENLKQIAAIVCWGTKERLIQEKQEIAE